MKELEKKLKREQRSLSRKYEDKKKRGERLPTKKSANIEKNMLRVQKLNQELSRKRQEYSYVVSILMKTKPKYITIEDLNISGMMKNKHLSKANAEQKFSYFKLWLTYKCAQRSIEARVADRCHTSSKLCCKRGRKKYDLKPKDRVFICECVNKIGRDLQAGINLERCENIKSPEKGFNVKYRGLTREYTPVECYIKL